MTRPVRHLLVLALIAWHSLAIALGPCAHSLAGTNHQAARPHDRGQADTLRAVDDSADCLICQFVAQGQLGATLPPPAPGPVVEPLDDPAASPSCPAATPRPTLPRAPPRCHLA